MRDRRAIFRKLETFSLSLSLSLYFIVTIISKCFNQGAFFFSFVCLIQPFFLSFFLRRIERREGDIKLSHEMLLLIQTILGEYNLKLLY